MLPRSRAFPFSGEKVSRAKRDSPKVVNVKVGQTAEGVALRGDWLWARETSNVCVHSEKEPGTDEMAPPNR
jgi:hypothetical protein